MGRLKPGVEMEKDPIKDVLVALRRVIRATDLHSRHLARTTGLTAPQILLLQAIRDCGQVTIGELARVVSLSQATVTTILDRLEARGLVYRQRSVQDKRKVHAHLTPAGAGVLQDAPVPLQDQFAARFAALQDWEQSMVIAALQRVAYMMDAEDIDASPVLDLGMLDRSEIAGAGSAPAAAPVRGKRAPRGSAGKGGA
jgi:DNA-binding MarR family transcriptional regulator